MTEISPRHPLRMMFAGLTENAFGVVLGVADPPMVDYVSGVLSRFVHVDDIFRLRDADGRRLDEVLDMIHEAESLPEEGRTRREVYRHIGDFTLFWTGLFPEALARMRSRWCKDYFVDYCEQGKRSYRIAGSCAVDDHDEESAVLLRLSEQFELCAYGLNEVRKEWEHIDPAIPRTIIGRNFEG